MWGDVHGYFTSSTYLLPIKSVVALAQRLIDMTQEFLCLDFVF